MSSHQDNTIGAEAGVHHPVRRRTLQQGFTLIELMIVIAIVGVLGSLALPKFQAHLVRAKVSEILTAAAACKTAVGEAVGSASQADVSALLPTVCESQSSRYVSSLSVDANGVITVVGAHAALRGDTSATANTLALSPKKAGGSALSGSADGGQTITEWQCGPARNNPMPTQYLPSSCQAS